MEKLREFKRYFLLVKFVENIFLFLGIFIFNLLLCVILKIPLYFSSISLFSFIYFFREFKRSDYFRIARKIEKKIPDLDEKIISYLEFSQSENKKEREIAKKLEKIFEKYNFKGAYPVSRVFPMVRLLTYSLMYSLLIFALFPYRFALYFGGEVKPPLYLKSEPSQGVFFVPKTLNIKAVPYGRKIDEVRIEYFFKGNRRVERMQRLNRAFVYSLNVFEPTVFRYRLETDGYKTSEKEILFKEKPFLKFWECYVKNPVGKVDTLYSPDRVNIFEGGVAEFEFEFGGDIDSGYIYLNEEIIKKFAEEKVKLNAQGNAGILKFVYFTDGVKTQDIQEIEIIRGEDNPPFIYVIFPPFDQEIEEDMKIPFAVYVMDDISLKYVDLFYEFREKDLRRIKTYKNQKEDTIFYNLDVSHLPLLPGDTIRVWFEVVDRGLGGKSQVARSKVYRFWIPTYTEIYKEASGEMEEGITFLEGEGKEVGDFLRDLKAFKEKIENFKEKKEFESLMETIENIEKSLKEISQRFEEYSKKIENLLKRYPLDAELQEKLFKLRELFREIMTPEFEKIFEDLKKAFNRLNPENLKEAYENLLLNKELLKEQIERTLELLEKVRQEVKLKEFIERMKEIERKLEELSLSPEKKSLRNFEEIKGRMQELSNQMEELAKSFEGEEKKVGKELESAREDVEKSLSELNLSMNLFLQGNLFECSGKASSSKKFMQGARQKTESALEDLLSMRKSIQAQKLEEIFFSAVLLSKKQSQILESIEKKEENIERVEAEVSDNRESLRRFKNKVVEFARKNITFPRNILNYVFSAYLKSEKLYEKMKIMELEDLDEISKEIFNYLNLTALEILRLQGEGQGGGASQALMQALKRLSQLAREQSHINALTQSLLPLQIGEAPSEEFLKSVQRIAGMQKSLAEKLKEVLESIKEAGGTEGIQRQMEKAIEEMEKVAKELEKGEVKREIIERQERILSRMLEVQRSVYKREFTKKRYAERVKPYKPLPPPSRVIEEDEIIKRSIIKVLNSDLPYEDKKVFIDYLNSLLK